MHRWLATILIAGVAGEIAFELFAWGIAPLTFGFALQPARLVEALFAIHAGIALPPAAAFAIHLAIGTVLFPLGYLLLRRFVLAGAAPWLAGLLYGLLLWFVAQGILAPLVGRPFMMDFAPYTWASLIAHPLMTLTIALVVQYRQRRSPDRTLPGEPAAAIRG